MIPPLRDEIQKLKKKEERKIIKNIQKTQAKEASFLERKYQALDNTYSRTKAKEEKLFNKRIEEMQNRLENSQKSEIENFTKKFDEKYPKESNHIPEIVQLKKRMDYFVKRNDFLGAQKIKDEMDNYLKAQHIEYENEKSKNFGYALEKLKFYTIKEKEEQAKDINNKIFEYNYRTSKEMKIRNDKKNIKVNSLRDIHNSEMNLMKNYIYDNNRKTGYNISRKIYEISI